MAERSPPIDRIELPATATERERRRGIGRLAGVLFLAGALLTVPALALLDPAPPSWVYLIIALGVCSGAACLVIPWDRLSPGWLHVMPIAATLEVTAAGWGAGAQGSLYAWLYALIAIGVAYAFRSRLTVAGYLIFLSLAVAAPIIDPPVSARDSLRSMLVAIPSLIVAAAVVVYFRERLEAGKGALEELARLDPLTGVGNYRTMYERLDYEIARHERHGRQFTVMLLDLHDFKQVNEVYGHLEGDRILSEVGKALAGTVRDQDTVARQGGDEFCVLAPETGASDATALAKRVDQGLGRVSVGDRLLSVSIGWAIYPDHGTTPEALLARADIALRRSKREAQTAREPEKVASEQPHGEGARSTEGATVPERAPAQ